MSSKIRKSPSRPATRDEVLSFVGFGSDPARIDALVARLTEQGRLDLGTRVGVMVLQARFIVPEINQASVLAAAKAFSNALAQHDAACRSAVPAASCSCRSW